MKLNVLVAAATAAVALSASNALAVSVDFTRITSNSSADAAAQLVLDVTDGGNGALFTFSVLDGANPGASIAEIYFEDSNSLFSSVSLFSQSAGVSYEVGTVNPTNLPGRNNATPPFAHTDDLVAQADGDNATGVGVGEELVLNLIYASLSIGFQDVLDALEAGDLRVGLHVRSLLAGESDAFVSLPPDGDNSTVVPVPAAGLLLLSGIAGLGFVRRRRRTAA